MPSYQQEVSTVSSPNTADVSTASILKSVKEQEAQFERLTRELEAERKNFAYQYRFDKPRTLTPDSPGMSSVSSHDDSLLWSSPVMPPPRDSHLEEESGDASKMSSNLLDSCLRELEVRGTLKKSEERRMDYMQADPYSHGGDSFFSPQSYGGGGGVGNVGYTGNVSFEQHSPHSSHLSLQSTGSNRPGVRHVQTTRVVEQQNGNYQQYTTVTHTEESHGAPLPRSGSPTGQYYERESPYHNLPPYREFYSPTGLGPDPNARSPHIAEFDDSFGAREEYLDSRNNYMNARQPYGDSYDDHPYRNQPPDEPYRGSPMLEPYDSPHQGGVGYHQEYLDDRHNPQDPPYNDNYHDYPNHNGRIDESDHYSDRHDESLPHYDDSFHGQRLHGDNQPVYERDQYLDDPHQRRSYDHDGPQGQYGAPPPEEDPPRYRSSYDHDGQYMDALPEEHAPPRYRGSFDNEGPAGPHSGLQQEGDPRYRGSYDHEGPAGPHSGLQQVGDPRYRGSFDHEGPAGPHGGMQQDGDPRYRGSYQGRPPSMSRDPNDSYNETARKFDGLPPLQTDPFADDPFREQRSHDGSFTGLRDEDLYKRGPSSYNRGPSPLGGSDLYRGRYDNRPGDYDPRSYDEGDGPGYPTHSVPHYDDYLDSGPYPGDGGERQYYPEEEDLVQRMGTVNLGAPPMDGYHSDNQRTPSIDGRPTYGDFTRAPDLQEVIEYLNSPDDSIKANAAAYLQHLSFSDDGIKAKTRSLDGLRPLIQLLSHELTEVHKNACGALQNLSYGKANDENKRAIKNEGGIPELIRLLRKTDQEDVMDSVTGVLWNLSSCEDLKQAIIDDGLTVLVNVVILPYSGWSSINSQPSQRPWTTVFRNTTGILRNISSAGYDARKKLRECRGLVNALIHTLQLARDNNNIDSKPVENVICLLRNLSYRIQEMEDPDFFKKRSQPKNTTQQTKGENAGCFGGGTTKKTTKKSTVKEPPQRAPPNLPSSSSEYRSLWGNDLILLYLTVLKTCTNPVSIEAAAGAIQNLTACDWEPAVECRAIVRKAKGLPTLVDLLSNESHRVVCAAATALRNLTIDEKNKELVGKYSIQQLVAWLPKDSRHSANKSPDDLTCAVLATLYEVIRSNQDYAVSLIQEDGLSRLKYINTSDGKFLARTLKINHTILKTLWSFKTLHAQYQRMGFTEPDFLVSKAMPRSDGYKDGTRNTMSSSNQTTPYNTLSRPISAQGYDDNTISAGRVPSRMDRDRGNYSGYGGSRTDVDGYLSMKQSNPALFDQNRGNYSRERLQPDSIPMNDMGPGYAPLDEPRPHKKPAGGVPLFPNLTPSPGDDVDTHSGSHDLSIVPEPLYAQVNKNKRRNDDYGRGASGNGAILDGSGAQGADSWV